MELYQIWLICSAPIVFAAFTVYSIWADNRDQRSQDKDGDKAFSLFIESWIDAVGQRPAHPWQRPEDEIEKRGK